MAGVQYRARVVPVAAGAIRTPPAGGLTAKETVDLRPKADSGTREPGENSGTDESTDTQDNFPERRRR